MDHTRMQGFNQPKSLNENLKASSSSSKSQLRNNSLSLQHQSLLDYEGITTTMPSEFDELNHFGHHAMPENPASIGAYAQSETFSWADDLFLLGEGTSNELMHHPEIVGTIDESDGTSTNLPNSSSSKSFKRRKISYANQGRDIPGTSSTESSISQPYTFSFVESTSSSMPSPFSFDESDSDIDQCTSSSELCVIKQDMTLPVVVKEELSDKQPDHRQITSQQPASTDKMIPCITSEHSSLKLDTFLKTEVLERDNFFDTDSECSQEELLLKETAETTGFSKRVSQTKPTDALQVIGVSSDPQPIQVSIGSDMGASLTDESGTSASQGRIHQFPSDILKTISPSKGSATIMSQPQHMDADLVENSLPSTTIVYTGTQNTCVSSKQQLLILAPVISSLDSLDDTNSTPGVTSYSHKIPNATAGQVGIPEGLVSSGHSALSNMDTEWRSTCTSLSDKPTSDVFELFEQSGQDGHSTTTKTLSSVKPLLNQRLSKDSQKERPTKADATSITLPKHGDCIEQFDLPRKDLKGELDFSNQTNSVLKAANPLSERLQSRQWVSGRPDTNVSAVMKSSASPSTLTPLAINTHEHSNCNNMGIQRNVSTKCLTHSNKGSAIFDKEQVVLPQSRQNDIQLVENVDHFVKGNLEKMDTLNSKETSEQNLLSSTNLSGVERGAKKTSVSGGTQNSNKTDGATQQGTLFKNAVNKQSLPSVQEKTIMSENQDLLEEMNTEEDKSPKPASALHLPDVSDVNQNEQEEAVGIKVMEMHSDDSDIDIDIDDLLEKELEQQVDNKGKKRTVNGEEKNNDVFVRSKVREPAEEEREQGVISVRDKIVLKKRGREPLEGLPENWMSITHRCGIDVYIHKPSRVCTWSRPYFLGPGSVRKHKVPLASIPCLHYKRAKEEEATSAEETAESSKEQSKSDINPDSSSGDPCSSKERTGAPVGSSTAQKGDDRFKNKLQMRPDEALEAGDLHSYAKKLFDFEEVKIRKFQTWSARRNYWKQRKAKEVVDRPQLPTVPTYEVEVQNLEGNALSTKKELVMNIQDKSPIAVLHEYCQKVLRVHPKFTVEESNNSNYPFEAVVFVDGTKYGRGQAQNKKAAKVKAAQETLEILLPGIMNQNKPNEDDNSMEFFNQISIDDPRVADLCLKTGNLSPFCVLQDYKQRMHGKKDMELNFNVTVTGHHTLSYTMSLGPFSVTGPCKNSKSGKQIGAQLILKQIYPKVTTWGGIIKMYGKGVTEISKAKKEEEKKILALSNKPKNKPNEKIMAKLKEEMRKAYGAKIAAEQNKSSSELSSMPSTSLE